MFSQCPFNPKKTFEVTNMGSFTYRVEQFIDDEKVGEVLETGYRASETAYIDEDKLPREKILVTVSGGRSSCFMAGWAKSNYDPAIYDVQFVFANTGQEMDETLDFMWEVDKHFSLNATWVEACVWQGRIASTSEVVDYHSAVRRDRWEGPYLDVVKKYGVPNKAYPHCSRELKENPIHHYVQKVLGWEKGTYGTAIGIRGDEPKRLNRNKTSQNKFYPLADMVPMTQQMIRDYWKSMPFDLGIEDYQGNCAWCFKKCEKKLLTIMDSDPSIFEFPDMLEKEYGHVGGNKIKGEYSKLPRTLYRNYMTADKLIDKFLLLDTLPEFKH